MTTAAELEQLVDCTSFTSALRDWATARQDPIHFNEWQKGNAELRRCFLDAPMRRENAASWNEQVVVSWRSIMREVHGPGWRGKLRTKCSKAGGTRRDEEINQSHDQHSEQPSIKRTNEKRRLKRKQPVYYSIRKHPDHDINENLHRVIATTVLTWTSGQREKLFEGLTCIYKPIDEKTRRLHMSLEKTNMPGERKAAWVADQIALALGGSDFADQKQRWDRLAEAALVRKPYRRARTIEFCRICAAKFPSMPPSSEDNHRCVVCLVEFQLLSVDDRRTHKKRPTAPLVCPNCRNSGITPYNTKWAILFRGKESDAPKHNDRVQGTPASRGDASEHMHNDIRETIALEVAAWPLRKIKKVIKHMTRNDTDGRRAEPHFKKDKAAWIAEEVACRNGTKAYHQRKCWDILVREATRDGRKHRHQRHHL